MEVAALSLLLGHQSGLLNPLVDCVVPLYTLAVLLLIYQIHDHTKKYKDGIYNADDMLYDSGEVLLRQKKEEEEAAAEELEAQNESSDTKPNFSGDWKSDTAKNVNYANFLKFQGVPSLKASIGNSKQHVHKIAHDENSKSFTLENKLMGETFTFAIDGPASTSIIGKKNFEDKMFWNTEKGHEKELILLKKNLDDGMELEIIRIPKSRKEFVMKQKVTKLATGDVVEAEQTFKKD